MVIKSMRGIARLPSKLKLRALVLHLTNFDQLLHSLTPPDSMMAIHNQALRLLGYFGTFRLSAWVTFV